ncbi:MAG: heparinase II/III family protein [Candidatus Hydrogenedentes bacterium]|nr:heparinase II/III family protein [Candidatus Hydrogenedentota bacterium]
MTRFSHSLALIASLLIAATGAAAPQVPSPDSVLDTLRPGHPRLVLTEERLQELKSIAQTDTLLQGFVNTTLAGADELLGAPPLVHKLTGPRLLSVSRACVDRVYSLGLAWRWTGDEKYARALEANLLTVCAFPDWNPLHFLDTAEMSHAVGVGLDWGWAFLSAESRETIRQGLIKHGMEPGKKAYEHNVGWTKSDFNWNQVCNAGLVAGALAIADTDPDYARLIVPRAVASLPIALASYAPDGAWMEGPSYWHYATRYTAYGLCALDTALGTDFGLSALEGLAVTGYFPDYATGPTGLLLNYADSSERSTRKPMPCMFWLAQKYGNAAISDAEHRVLASGNPTPEHIVWYLPPSGNVPTLDLDKHFRSPVDIIVMRSAWNDPNALFAGVKGGYNEVNHGHLDLGNFELDALGVRWARDLGSDNYNLPGYFDKKRGGKRWNYYRMRSLSHNVPLLNGADQEVVSKSTVTAFNTQPDSAFVTLDLSEAYGGKASAVSRTVALVNRRRAALVLDRFTLPQPAEVLWAMTTDAEIAPGTDGAATLTLEGKQLIARLLSPAGAQFTVESAEQPEPEKTNAGVRRLLVRLEGQSGDVTVAVALCPVWPDGGAETTIDFPETAR